MRLFLLVPLCLLVTSCISLQSDEYYKMKTAEYNAYGLAAAAHNSRPQHQLVSFNPKTNVFTVYDQRLHTPIMPPVQKNAIVEFADTVLNSDAAKLGIGFWGAGYFAGKVQGNYNSGGGEINVTRDSGNTNTLDVNNLEGQSSFDNSVDNSIGPVDNTVGPVDNSIGPVDNSVHDITLPPANIEQ